MSRSLVGRLLIGYLLIIVNIVQLGELDLFRSRSCVLRMELPSMSWTNMPNIKIRHCIVLTNNINILMVSV